MQRKVKPKATIGAVGCGDCTAVELHGVLHNGESEPRATLLA